MEYHAEFIDVNFTRLIQQNIQLLNHALMFISSVTEVAFHSAYFERSVKKDNQFCDNFALRYNDNTILS